MCSACIYMLFKTKLYNLFVIFHSIKRRESVVFTPLYYLYFSICSFMLLIHFFAHTSLKELVIDKKVCAIIDLDMQISGKFSMDFPLFTLCDESACSMIELFMN